MMRYKVNKEWLNAPYEIRVAVRISDSADAIPDAPAGAKPVEVVTARVIDMDGVDVTDERFRQAHDGWALFPQCCGPRYASAEDAGLHANPILAFVLEEESE